MIYYWIINQTSGAVFYEVSAQSEEEAWGIMCEDVGCEDAPGKDIIFEVKNRP
jgi:hypothetical protein